MKKTKRISALLLCILMLCSTVLLCACQSEPKETESSDAAYKVTVVDGLGNPYTEKIIVKFMQNGTQAAMAAVNAQGVVEKTLPKGDYTVEIDATGDSDCYYDTTAAKLSADKTELTIIMAYLPGENTSTLYANSVATGENIGYEAVNLSVGSTYVSLDTADRTYFLFTPTQAGTYEISTTGGSTTVGYYGAPHFVQSNNVGEVENNVLTLTVYADMISTGATGTSVYVIGVDSVDGTTETILNIARTGDPAWSITEEPWSNYQPKIEITDFTLPEGTVLKDFDITASTDTYKLVLNEQDRCYHLGTADGPMVYVQLEKAMYGISMLTMVGEIVYDADGILMQTGTTAFRYMYDNGPDDFFKEDYTDAMRKYVTARDKTTGVYPLNEDLYYILPMGIENIGWCREGTVNYLFNGVDNANPDITWMFMLCHAEGDITGGTEDPGETTDPGESTDPGSTTKPDPKPTPIVDNKDEPIIPIPEDTGLGDNSTHFEATIQPNHETYFNLYRMVTAVILTIDNEDAYVIYNGKTYEAKNGVVTVSGIQSQYTNSPVEIVIGNKGTAEATFDVKLSHPAGTQSNPYKLKLGTFTTKLEKGNEMGAFYSWTATKSGTFTITLDSATNNANVGITITVVEGNIPVQYSMAEGETSLSVEVKEGESISIVIAVEPDEKWNRPASEVKTTASVK